MKRLALLLLMSALMGCDRPPPVVTAVEDLCYVTTRYHATDAQRAAFKADPPLWESLVNWMFSFNQVRDKRCLQPAKGA